MEFVTRDDYGQRFLPAQETWVIKKDGSREAFNVQKVVNAVSKSAYRALTQFTDEDYSKICSLVIERVDLFGEKEIPIRLMHNIVEEALEKVKPVVAKSYRDYRNYKQDVVRMLDDVYKKSQSIMYIGDDENAGTESASVSTKRNLIFNQLNKELYQRFFLTTEEIQACRDGYVYIHDMSARRDTINSCVFDVGSVLKDGFEMGNIHYNEPKTLDVAFDVIGDIILSAAGQQYGGFTVSNVELLLEPYAEKTYEKALRKYTELGVAQDKAKEQAERDVAREFEQGFQGWEYKFNTVASSRGDYPFITVTAGTGTGRFARMATLSLLKVRMDGQGKEGEKTHVRFPKIVFLYDEALHAPGKEFEFLFDAAVRCSEKAGYPAFLSLTGGGREEEMYRLYGEVISPMGSRGLLSPWYEKGGLSPADETDRPVFTGRCNIGVVSLHLPMILARARKESRDFYELLDDYLNLIRQLHLRTYAYLGEMKASTDPLAYCQGGIWGGHLKPEEKIKPLLRSATASFGITALNELQQLYNGKDLNEDNSFALEVTEYISAKIEGFRQEDGRAYVLYATPAVLLGPLQVKQFRRKFGIVEGVSDGEAVTNSFHCPEKADLTPEQKQDLELRFWELFDGGKLQIVRLPKGTDISRRREVILRAMKLGLYEEIQ
ncbi:MAG: anaerobic ribonucleoside-triphosphate reductase [Lachnospiraceae bacterium]|nr:anaerobic ribonucleoside-triphosphate reductase [Lachnospiraceae bacterium]